MNRIPQQFAVLPLRYDILHQLAADIRCPAAVPDDGNLSVRDIHFRADGKECAHQGIDCHIHCRSGKNDVASAENFCK